MYQTLQTIHSYWAYLVLALLIIATINAISGMASKRDFTEKDLRISLFALIVTHIQLLIGLVLYMVSPLGIKNISSLGMGEVMKNSEFRLYAVEHPMIMIIAAILITIGFSRHKKKQLSQKKFSSITVFYIITLILMLSRIPWNAWF